MMALVVACALTLGAEAAEGPVWRNIGPGGGGWIQSLAASPHDVGELLVGCDVGGFYRSVDGGASYTVHNAGLEDYYVECIVPHPTNPAIIYLGCNSGVYRGDDHGSSWRWLRNGFGPVNEHKWSAPIGAMAIDPQNPDVVYAGIGRPRHIDYGTGSIYRTTDGGAHWSRVNAEASLPGDAVITDLLLDPRESGRMFACTQRGLFVSVDGGVNWRKSGAGLPHDHVRRIAVCREKPDVMYVTMRSEPGVTPWHGGVYKSVDGGRSWSAAGKLRHQQVGKPGAAPLLTANYDRIVVHPTNPDVAYVGGSAWVSAGVYRTTDGGATWVETTRTKKDANTDVGWINFAGLSATTLVMSPVDPQRLWFGTSMHLMSTRDGGESWQPAYTKSIGDHAASTGLETTCLHSIIVDPRNSSRVLLGYYDIGLVMSEDAGNTFTAVRPAMEPRNVTNSLWTAAFDPVDANKVWGSFGAWGTNEGVISVSRDGAKTWTVVGHPGNGLPMARHPQVFVADGRVLATADEHGVYASEDEGQSWHESNGGLPGREVRRLARVNAHSFVAVANGQHPSLYRSDDAGRNWRKIGELPTLDARDVIAADAQGNRLYVAGRRLYRGKLHPGGVFASSDGGVTWKQVLDDRFAECLAIDPRDPSVVFAGLHDHPYHDRSIGGGLRMSRDGGVTWTDLTSSTLHNHSVSCITVDAAGGKLYVGTAGNGVFVTLLP